jgi:CheY-like chemotaxis protein
VRVDIYSLGCMAFELLTGQVPFPGAEPDAILSQHLHRLPPRVSDFVAVPPALDQLIAEAEMMNKHPRQRPESVDVVGAWLCGIHRGQREPLSGAPLGVVIADDDPDMRAILATFVEQTVPGAEVRQAGDGEEALREIRRSSPDLALIDLDMPRLSGIELCMVLRGTSRAAQTAIAAISGAASESDRKLLGELGVTTFIRKDENAGDLLARVRALLLDISRTRSRVLAGERGGDGEPARPESVPGRLGDARRALTAGLVQRPEPGPRDARWPSRAFRSIGRDSALLRRECGIE